MLLVARSGAPFVASDRCVRCDDLCDICRSDRIRTRSASIGATAPENTEWISHPVRAPSCSAHLAHWETKTHLAHVVLDIACSSDENIYIHIIYSLTIRLYSQHTGERNGSSGTIYRERTTQTRIIESWTGRFTWGKGSKKHINYNNNRDHSLLVFVHARAG